MFPAARLSPVSQIRLLRYAEDVDEISCAAVYAHANEVLDLCASPTNAALIATVYDDFSGPGARCTVWRMPDLPAADAVFDRGATGTAPEPPTRELERVADVPLMKDAAGAGSDAVARVAWAPHVSGHVPTSFVTAHGACVRAWSLSAAGGVEPAGAAAFDAPAPHVGAVAWDPHHASQVAVAAGAAVYSWDLRVGERARAIEHAVQAGCGVVRALSFNPNRPWVLATAGDDFRVKIWDLRKPAAPLKVLEGHSHWCVKTGCRSNRCVTCAHRC